MLTNIILIFIFTVLIPILIGLAQLYNKIKGTNEILHEIHLLLIRKS